MDHRFLCVVLDLEPSLMAASTSLFMAAMSLFVACCFASCFCPCCSQLIELISSLNLLPMNSVMEEASAPTDVIGFSAAVSSPSSCFPGCIFSGFSACFETSCANEPAANSAALRCSRAISSPCACLRCLLIALEVKFFPHRGQFLQTLPLGSSFLQQAAVFLFFAAS